MIALDELTPLYGYVVALPLILLLMLLLLARYRLKSAQRGVALVLVWNLLLSLFLATAFFATAETWYRFVVDRTDAVGFMRIAERWHKRHYHRNEQGWRDNIDYHLEPRRLHRITILGDSFTEGSGVKDVDDRFGNRLRALRPDTEVHVLGRNGFQTTHHLKTARYLCDLQYPTSVVLLAYMLNDIGFAAEDYATVHNRMWGYNRSLSRLQRRSYFLNTMTFRWKVMIDPDLKKHDAMIRNAYRGAAWHQNIALLRELRRLLAQSGVPLVVATFPHMRDLKRYPFGPEHAQIASFWKAEGVPHLDLLTTYRDHADASLAVNYWDGHPNEYANQLAAEAISAFLDQQNPIGSAAPRRSAADATGGAPMPRLCGDVQAR